ncbi:MAG TPA: carbamoyltransferase HypF [Solirubrobacteraceae bacterium]|jgi:hydrogenase maturation protein HypF
MKVAGEPLYDLEGSSPRRRLRARVRGVVQGVGFRPYVYRLAQELGLSGFVLNDVQGVLLEVEGAEASVERFMERLLVEAPPLASIEHVEPGEIAPTGEDGFRIAASRWARASSRDREGSAALAPSALISPDTATCADCLVELLDRKDRRYRYPFINCTNCGPRFTIARGVPYDRALTTMAAFVMCERCRAEYENPLDRRFHAQPNACPECGPSARLVGADGVEHSTTDALRTAAASLKEGQILAVKGLGGFHLACRADAPAAVAALRARKHREDRPFALMAPSLAAAEELVWLSAKARALLEDRARPIVIAPRREQARVADAVAPHIPDLGVMLPYTPLHHLLLADLGEALVMTSGNCSDEPIAYADEDAIARLRGIADAFLLHDRPIHMRTDDSVARTTSRGPPLLLRRSRGYVPAPIGLPVPAGRPLLACGAELKSTFCVARGEQAWVSHHVGDLKNYETLNSFRTGVEHFEHLFSVVPEVLAHDLHPEYLSSKYALEREGVELFAVQHHHAHLAACLAEHGELGPAVGAVFDGAGYGSDGTIWGGELLVGGLRDFERVGHLRAVRLPGGEQAVREPWRMACAWLVEASGERRTPLLPGALVAGVTRERWETIARLARSELAPVTTSAGRLFDAVAALCGLRASVTYEGQAAIELEARVDPTERGGYPIELEDRSGVLELDPRVAISEVLRERTAGVPVGKVAARFHAGLARATARACALLASERGLEVVVLAGGVFQNRVLLELTLAECERAGLRPLVPERLPPGDGAISYGQAAVAAARISD